jgi:hypothetical protein
MAGQAEPAPNTELEVGPKGHPNATDKSHRDIVREHAAKLYGQGFPRAKVARLMVDHLVPHQKDRPLEQRLSQARAKLRRWEGDEKFRDMVYHRAVVEIDMATPGIIKGVIGKAKRGRVDAARFALELSGRHNPKGDSAPAQVVVAINGIPRPHTVVNTELEIEGTVIAEDEG